MTFPCLPWTCLRSVYMVKYHLYWNVQNICSFLIKMQIWRTVVSTHNSQCLTRWIITAGIKLSPRSCCQWSVHQCLIPMEGKNPTEWSIVLSLQMGFVFIITNNPAASAKRYSLIGAVFSVRERMVTVKSDSSTIALKSGFSTFS